MGRGLKKRVNVRRSAAGLIIYLGANCIADNCSGVVSQKYSRYCNDCVAQRNVRKCNRCGEMKRHKSKGMCIHCYAKIYMRPRLDSDTTPPPSPPVVKRRGRAPGSTNAKRPIAPAAPASNAVTKSMGRGRRAPLSPVENASERLALAAAATGSTASPSVSSASTPTVGRRHAAPQNCELCGTFGRCHAKGMCRPCYWRWKRPNRSALGLRGRPPRVPVVAPIADTPSSSNDSQPNDQFELKPKKEEEDQEEEPMEAEEAARGRGRRKRFATAAVDLPAIVVTPDIDSKPVLLVESKPIGAKRGRKPMSARPLADVQPQPPPRTTTGLLTNSRSRALAVVDEVVLSSDSEDEAEPKPEPN